MVVADARALPPSSLARTVREQGLQFLKLKSEHNELQRENLDVRIDVNDVAESLAALIAALLPGCPVAAKGGLVPTAASIKAAAAQAVHDTAASVFVAAQTETPFDVTQEAEHAATIIQAAARGWSCRARINSSSQILARVALATVCRPASETAGVVASSELLVSPDLGVIVGEMRELASYVRQLPTDTGPAVAERPSSAPVQDSYSRRSSRSAASSSAQRSSMAAVPEKHARPQSAPARRHRQQGSMLGSEGKQEARRAAAVAREAAVSAEKWKHGLPVEQIPARRAPIHGERRPASAGSINSRHIGRIAADSDELEAGAVRQESEETWLARQPGGKAGHLSYVKSRIHNTVTLTKESDKQAVREQAVDATLTDPPVRWIEKGKKGWGRWVTAAPNAASGHTSCQDAVQISHTQASRRPQSAPPSSAPTTARHRQRQLQGQQKRTSGRARLTKGKTTRRGIPPIFCAEDDTADRDGGMDKDEAVVSPTGTAASWSERAEWKREQKKWSQLAREALRSMEKDEEQTDLALIMRQMENDPAAAATILGEAAVAAADAALAASESLGPKLAVPCGRPTGANKNSCKPANDDESSLTRPQHGQQRRGWRQYLESRGRRKHRKVEADTNDSVEECQEKGQKDEVGVDELADYYDWLLSMQQAAERDKSKSQASTRAT